MEKPTVTLAAGYNVPDSLTINGEKCPLPKYMQKALAFDEKGRMLAITALCLLHDHGIITIKVVDHDD